MTEVLVKYDPDEIFRNTKQILTENGQIPTRCPSTNCLSLSDVNLANGRIRVRLNAQPPRLETTKEWLDYETHPTCRYCGIQGNSNRVFQLNQNSESGEIKFAEAKWKIELY